MEYSEVERKMAEILNGYRKDGRSWTWLSRKFDIIPSTLQCISTQKHHVSVYTAAKFFDAVGMELDVRPKKD